MVVVKLLLATGCVDIDSDGSTALSEAERNSSEVAELVREWNDEISALFTPEGIR